MKIMLHVFAIVTALVIPPVTLWCVVLIYGWYGYDSTAAVSGFSIEESLVFSVVAYLLLIGFLSALWTERQ